jgi:hypothetical protein
MDFLGYILIAGIACAYLIRVLLLEQKVSHEGPFVLKETFVLFQDTKHVQRFALFDIIRLVFGAYKRVPEMTAQRVYTLRNFWIAEVWTCPVCLSFWAAFPLSLSLSFLYHPPFILYVLVHLAIAGIGLLIFRRTEE